MISYLLMHEMQPSLFTPFLLHDSDEVYLHICVTLQSVAFALYQFFGYWSSCSWLMPVAVNHHHSVNKLTG